jgi:hypothetical protein
MTGGLLLLLVLQVPDTARVSPTPAPPAEAGRGIPSGQPSLRLATGQGVASIWLLHTADSAYVVAQIPDTTYYWGDDLVISLDVSGDGGAAPGHDDFQWYFRRALDSSVVYRGRGGRWEAPRGDPSWRLGPSREGGGWTVSGASEATGWSVVLRLDGAWLAGEAGRRPRLAVRIYDDSPGGWFAWPTPLPGKQPSGVEGRPDAWGSAVLEPGEG